MSKYLSLYGKFESQQDPVSYARHLFMSGNFYELSQKFANANPQYRLCDDVCKSHPGLKWTNGKPLQQMTEDRLAYLRGMLQPESAPVDAPPPDATSGFWVQFVSWYQGKNGITLEKKIIPPPKPFHDDEIAVIARRLFPASELATGEETAHQILMPDDGRANPDSTATTTSAAVFSTGSLPPPPNLAVPDATHLPPQLGSPSASGMITPSTSTLAQDIPKLSKNPAHVSPHDSVHDPRQISLGNISPTDYHKTSLQPVEIASGDGVVVAGVDCEPNARRAAQMLATVHRLRNEFCDLYFDDVNTQQAAPLLYVYANLSRHSNSVQPSVVSGFAQSASPSSPSRNATLDPDDETIGQALCDKVDFRAMDDMEGYYEPLDNSIVLRRGLIGSNGVLYEGTIAHELCHSLIAAEFPEAPVWLNEGIASLYAERDANGNPEDNYALYYVKEAANHHILPHISELLRLDSPDGPYPQTTDGGIIMSSVRYLSFFLWQYHPKDRPNNSVLQTVYPILRRILHKSGTAIANPSFIPLDPDNLEDPGFMGNSGSHLEPPVIVGNHAAEVAESALVQLTGKNLDTLDAEFQAFISNRSTAIADINWKRIGDSIQKHVLTVVSHTPGSSQ